jgi:NTE family protein
LLPALERRYSFHPRAGTGAVERAVLLSDGGIYDNLALTVLEPGRSRFHTAHVFDLDYVVLCDAGRGPLRLSSGHFAISRMRRSFETAYRRAQDGSRRVLYQALENGRLKGVIHVYLGMDDGRLPVPMADLVPRTSVDRYPTDFRSMSGARMDQLTTRGEQLTRALLQCYCPEL